MADSTLTGLASATLPLAGTETIYIVQDSTSVKTTVGDLPTGITTTDVLNMKVVRTDNDGFLIDYLGAGLSGSPSVADYTALVALDAASYDGYAVNIQSGMNNAFFASNGSAFEPLNGSYNHEKQNTSVAKYVAPESGLTWTAANVGGFVVVTTGASANHGLTANAIGAAIKVKTTQNNWVAQENHVISAVTTTAPYTITLTTSFSSHGVPVFYAKGEEVKLKEFTIPVLRSNSVYKIESGFRVDVDSSSTKHLFFYLENTALQDFTLSGNQYQPWNCGFYNVNDVAVNHPLFNTNSNGTAASTGAFIANQAVDTSTGTAKCSLRFTPTNANVVCEIPRYIVKIEG